MMAARECNGQNRTHRQTMTRASFRLASSTRLEWRSVLPIDPLPSDSHPSSQRAPLWRALTLTTP